ncbi:yjiA [Symbiodinium natans]|uniref:YjiA protein n=1 Tax=Symbiodinium natans TaxID=878477 RepID=A0A812UXX0_9DINO|nr:yjiA [Symbiodinium natans]
MCIFCEKAKGELSGNLTAAQKREIESCVELQERRIRATILTGFLGAGKTTFLNFVLKSLGHGKRIAVVQNEFGKVPVDDQLMLLEQSAAETIVMPNGCLCCRVRGDLVEALRCGNVWEGSLRLWACDPWH